MEKRLNFRKLVLPAVILLFAVCAAAVLWIFVAGAPAGKTDGDVVIGRYKLTEGEREWKNFVYKAHSDIPASIRVYRNNWVFLRKYSLREIDFDGEKFTLRLWNRARSGGEPDFVGEYTNLYNVKHDGMDLVALINAPRAEITDDPEKEALLNTYYSVLSVKNEGVVYAVRYSDIFIEHPSRYGTIYYDIDGDGKEEICCLDHGGTSGVGSFMVTVYDGEIVEYKTRVNSPWGECYWLTDENGRLLVGVAYSDGIEKTVYRTTYEPMVKNGVLTFTRDGKEPYYLVSTPIMYMNKSPLYGLPRAIDEGHVAIDGNTIVYGDGIWSDFVAAAQAGIPAQVYVYRFDTENGEDSRGIEITYSGGIYRLQYYYGRSDSAFISREYKHMIFVPADNAGENAVLGDYYLSDAPEVNISSELVYSVKYGTGFAHGGFDSSVKADIDLDGVIEDCYFGFEEGEIRTQFVAAVYSGEKREYIGCFPAMVEEFEVGVSENGLPFVTFEDIGKTYELKAERGGLYTVDGTGDTSRMDDFSSEKLFFTLEWDIEGGGFYDSLTGYLASDSENYSGIALVPEDAKVKAIDRIYKLGLEPNSKSYTSHRLKGGNGDGSITLQIYFGSEPVSRVTCTGLSDLDLISVRGREARKFVRLCRDIIAAAQ